VYYETWPYETVPQVSPYKFGLGLTKQHMVNAAPKPWHGKGGIKLEASLTGVKHHRKGIQR
jgi:hypothetical protein